jgi:ABC-type multidrug transport system fused ATPase/permease subunit
LARAIVSDPPILVFDEPTSALDAESESIVQAALDHVCIGKTTVSRLEPALHAMSANHSMPFQITVAHRLSTIRHANNIVVMKNGRVAEQGDHEHLLQMNGEYAQLVSAQRLETAVQEDPLDSPTESLKGRTPVMSVYSDSGLSSTTV